MESPEVSITFKAFKAAHAAWEEHGEHANKFQAYFSYAGYGLTAARFYSSVEQKYVTVLVNSEGEVVHSR